MNILNLKLTWPQISPARCINWPHHHVDIICCFFPRGWWQERSRLRKNVVPQSWLGERVLALLVDLQAPVRPVALQMLGQWIAHQVMVDPVFSGRWGEIPLIQAPVREGSAQAQGRSPRSESIRGRLICLSGVFPLAGWWVTSLYYHSHSAEGFFLFHNFIHLPECISVPQWSLTVDTSVVWESDVFMVNVTEFSLMIGRIDIWHFQSCQKVLELLWCSTRLIALGWSVTVINFYYSR